MSYLLGCFRLFVFCFHCLELVFPNSFMAHSSLPGICSIGTLPKIAFLTNQYKTSYLLLFLTLIFYLAFVRLYIHFLVCCLSNPLELSLMRRQSSHPPHPPHLQCLEQHLPLGSTHWMFGEQVKEWGRLHLMLKLCDSYLQMSLNKQYFFLNIKYQYYITCSYFK